MTQASTPEGGAGEPTAPQSMSLPRRKRVSRYLCGETSPGRLGGNELFVGMVSVSLSLVLAYVMHAKSGIFPGKYLVVGMRHGRGDSCIVWPPVDGENGNSGESAGLPAPPILWLLRHGSWLRNQPPHRRSTWWSALRRTDSLAVCVLLHIVLLYRHRWRYWELVWYCLCSGRFRFRRNRRAFPAETCVHRRTWIVSPSRYRRWAGTGWCNWSIVPARRYWAPPMQPIGMASRVPRFFHEREPGSCNPTARKAPRTIQTRMSWP